MKILYVETSALLQVLFHESGFEQTWKVLSNAKRVISSRLIRVEAERAVLRLAQRQPKYAQQIRLELESQLVLFWPKFDFIEMIPEVCNLAGKVAPLHSLRSLDAIHVATFFWLKPKEPKIELLSFDKKVIQAIQEG